MSDPLSKVLFGTAHAAAPMTPVRGLESDAYAAPISEYHQDEILLRSIAISLKRIADHLTRPSA